MVSKKIYLQNYYLLIGLVIGASFGFIGSFVSSSYYWSLEHPEHVVMSLFYFSVFTVLLIALIVSIYKLGKKIK